MSSARVWRNFLCGSIESYERNDGKKRTRRNSKHSSLKTRTSSLITLVLSAMKQHVFTPPRRWTLPKADKMCFRFLFFFNFHNGFFSRFASMAKYLLDRSFASRIALECLEIGWIYFFSAVRIALLPLRITIYQARRLWERISRKIVCLLMSGEFMELISANVWWGFNDRQAHSINYHKMHKWRYIRPLMFATSTDEGYGIRWSH